MNDVFLRNQFAYYKTRLAYVSGMLRQNQHKHDHDIHSKEYSADEWWRIADKKQISIV